jgi:hypothetical protein
MNEMVAMMHDAPSFASLLLIQTQKVPCPFTQSMKMTNSLFDVEQD